MTVPLAHFIQISFGAVYVVYAALVVGFLLCSWSMAARLVRTRASEGGATTVDDLAGYAVEAVTGVLCLSGIVSDSEQIVSIALVAFAALLGFAVWSDRGSTHMWPARPGPRFGGTRSERLVRGGVICLISLAGLWQHFIVNGGHFAPPEAKHAVIFASVALTAAGAMLLELLFDASPAKRTSE